MLTEQIANHPALFPYGQLVEKLEIVTHAFDGCSICITLKKNLKCQGSPVIICRSYDAARERLSLVRPC